MCLKMKDGTPLREWQFDDQGNFTFKKRQGRPSIVPTDQVKTFFEEAIPLGENVNSSHVKDMIASATKANDEAKGLYQEVLGRSNVKKVIMIVLVLVFGMLGMKTKRGDESSGILRIVQMICLLAQPINLDAF